MRITKDNTIAVIVDIQERLFPHIYDNNQLRENVTKLINGLQILQVPFIITEQYSKGLGKTIEPVAGLFCGVEPVEKLTFSCCDEPEFMGKVQASGRQNVLLSGIETHVCVLQTALDLKAAGFNPVIVEDCVSSRKLKDKEIALKRLHQEGVLFTSYESILFELCQIAGTGEFKAISKLVK